jgi:hypothetical protein
MSIRSIWGLAGPLALVMGLSGCGSAATLGTTMLTGLFTNATGPDDVATVNAAIRSNDTEQQLLQVITDDGLRGVVRWDVQTQVVHGTETYGAVALEPGDQVQLRLRRTSDVDIYTDYVLVRQRAQNAAADTAIVQLDGIVSELDVENGRFQLRAAGGRTVLVTLPYNPPEAVADRFSRLKDGAAIRIAGRYIADDRFELTRFEP